MALPHEQVRAELPGYRVLATWDLKEDTRAARAVQLLSLGVAALFVAGGFALSLGSGWPTLVTVAVTLGVCLLYMWGHEVTHGILLTLLSGRPSRYAVRFPYLTTGSDAFVGRTAFLLVALGPLVIWGVIFRGLLEIVPADAFLTVYVLCGLNLAGSAGDLYQSARVARVQGDAMFRDDGTVTTVIVPGG